MNVTDPCLQKLIVGKQHLFPSSQKPDTGRGWQHRGLPGHKHVFFFHNWKEYFKILIFSLFRYLAFLCLPFFPHSVFSPFCLWPLAPEAVFSTAPTPSKRGWGSLAAPLGLINANLPYTSRFLWQVFPAPSNSELHFLVVPTAPPCGTSRCLVRAHKLSPCPDLGPMEGRNWVLRTYHSIPTVWCKAWHLVGPTWIKEWMNETTNGKGKSHEINALNGQLYDTRLS